MVLHVEYCFPREARAEKTVIFGMMMSNSRLCEQIHGMMWACLRKDIGMDQSDPMLSHLMGLSYELREERRQSEADRPSNQAAKI